MRGIGSGRKCLNRMTSQWFRLDVRWLQKHGMLQEGVKRRFRMTREREQVSVLLHPHARTISLHLDLGQDLFGPRAMDTVVRLRWEPCPYGGVQPLLGCQGRACERYVHILYGRENFLCRRCRHVTYPIQRVHPSLRALARAQLLRSRLGGKPEEVNGPFPDRPKGMHAWTYTQKIGKILIAERAASVRLLDDFGKPQGRDPDREQKELFDEFERLAGDLEIPGSKTSPLQQDSACSRPVVS